MQYCGCNPGLRVYQATTLPTKLHSQPSLLLFLFLLRFLLYTSGFSAPSSGQTFLAQTKHLFIGTGHFSVSYTSESPSEAGPPCGVWAGSMPHTHELQLPQSWALLGVGRTPFRKQDFLRIPVPSSPTEHHRVLAFLSRKDQGFLSPERRLTSRSESVGGNPAMDLRKCLQAICSKAVSAARLGLICVQKEVFSTSGI